MSEKIRYKTISHKGKECQLSWTSIFTDFNLFYFFMMVMYVAQGNVLTRGATIHIGSPIYVAIPIILTIVLFIKNNIKLNKTHFLLFLLAFLIWTFLSFIKYNGWHPSVFFIYLHLFMGYGIVRVYKMKIFYLFEVIVSKLSIITLIVWISNLIFPWFWDLIGPYICFHTPRNIIEFNFFFSSVIGDDDPLMHFRNPGFSTEPGLFSSIICVAIFINLARTNFQLRNKNLIILLLNLLSTFSTTGYVTLIGVIFPFYLLNKSLMRSFSYLLLAFPVLFYIIQLDFMGNKITELQADTVRQQNIADLINEDGAYTPQRFDGLAFELMNIKNDPLLGYGVTVDNSFIKRNVSKELFLSNGILKLYSKYGLIFGLLLTIIMIKSSVLLKYYWKCKYTWFFFVLYEMISISYGFFYLPLFISFFFYPLFLTKGELKYLKCK